MRKILGTTLLLGSLVVTVSSCSKDDKAPEYTVPATYTFDNVSYTEATNSVAMWSGFTAWLGKGNIRQLSTDSVNYLWANTNNAFTTETVVNLQLTNAQINALGFGLNGKTTDAAVIKQYADSQVNVSKSFNVAATASVAGKIGNRLVNYKGFEFNQLVAKGLMGAFQLNKVFENLDKSKTADNNTVVAGTGTAMQHYWDLAFGYVGIPMNYDSGKAYASSDVTRPLAIGGYFAERGKFIKAGGTIYEAFRKGRAAIGAKDYAGRDAAIKTIKLMMEKTLAAAAYEYGKVAMSGALDVRFHGASEGAGFVVALKYRSSESPLSAADYQKLVDLLLNANLYELAADATNAKLTQFRTILSTAYGPLQAQ